MTPGILLRIPRWAWILIGLAIGLAIAYARQQSWSGDFGSRYGMKLNDRARFEASLLRDIEGQRAFKDLVVYPETITSAGGRKTQLHVVAGKFRGPLRAGEESGASPEIQKEWRAVYFVCEPPYSLAAPTVIAYFDTLASRGVSYRFAWWRRPLYWNALHAGIALIVVGFLWPSVINLLAFGTLTRPAPEPLPVLPRSSYSTAKPTPQPSTAELDAAVAQYTDGLEQSLSQGASESACSPGAAAVPAQAAAALSSAPLAPAVSAADQDDPKSFGADKEDYYPTELRAPHAPATTPHRR
jgi:hypothetical protein